MLERCYEVTLPAQYLLQERTLRRCIVGYVYHQPVGAVTTLATIIHKPNSQGIGRYQILQL